MSDVLAALIIPGFVVFVAGPVWVQLHVDRSRVGRIAKLLPGFALEARGAKAFGVVLGRTMTFELASTEGGASELIARTLLGDRAGVWPLVYFSSEGLKAKEGTDLPLAKLVASDSAVAACFSSFFRGELLGDEVCLEANGTFRCVTLSDTWAASDDGERCAAAARLLDEAAKFADALEHALAKHRPGLPLLLPSSSAGAILGEGDSRRRRRGSKER